MDDQQFYQLLEYFSFSRAGYRKVRKGVKKRIRRHMEQVNCRHLQEYILTLENNEELRLEFQRLMTVSISRFFRDRGLWQTLEQEILPEVIAAHEDTIRAWSAGCACGEEAYSLRILYDRLKGRFERLPNLEILATDIHPFYLKRARAGKYAASSLRDVPDKVRSVFFSFQEAGGCYVISDLLKGHILWKEHDLLDGSPGGGFHLIFLRNNLLTYYKNQIWELPFRGIVESLLPGGFFIVGSHERLPLEKYNLVPYGSWSYIFQKRGFPRGAEP
jgi:chemotaxis protein methyltransferase CheR